MSYVIRIIMLATGMPSMLDGAFVQEYEDDETGRGRLVCTRDRAEAMQFDSTKDAFNFWNQQSKVQPLRDDGEPNKPLTSFTVSIEA